MSRLDPPEFSILLKGLPPARRWAVAYSGGVDSHVLLHALSLEAKARDIPLRALHVHHGLQDQADAWDVHCERTAQALGVDYLCVTVDVEVNTGDSLEEQARDARLAGLSAQIGLGELLFTAQHADDQAETVMLQLLRGAGVRGLSAMPRLQPFGTGWQVRPLLDVTRAEIEAYAHDHQLEWVEDPSNQDRSYARNYLRHDVMPKLRERWPSAAQSLGRSAELCAEAESLLLQRGREDLEAVRDDGDRGLPIDALKALDGSRLRNLLRVWIAERDLLPPSRKVLQRVQQELIPAKDDAQPKVHWQGAELRRYQNRVYLLPELTDMPEDWSAEWDGLEPLSLPGGAGQLELLDGNGPYTVRFRQDGDRVTLSGRDHSKSLKKFWQEQGIPPWLRDRVPLLLKGERIVLIGDRWPCENDDVLLNWQRSGALYDVD